MTKKDEEKAREIALKYSREYLVSRNDSHKQNILFKESSIIECEKASLETAQWKNEQLEAEKQALIDKACEWLRNNSYMLDNWDEDKCWVTFEFTSKDEMIKEFHKAMKGGEE